MTERPLSSALDDLEQLRRARSVILIGEIHGTRQFPELIGMLLAASVTDGLAVTLGLEVPCSEQDNIDRLLVGDETDNPIGGPWWERAAEYRDGRSSRSMADLLAGAADLVRSGADVSVVAMDGPWVAPGSMVPLEFLGELEQNRDQGMAVRLLDAMDRRPRALTLVLAGSEHTAVVPPNRLAAAGEPLRAPTTGDRPRPLGSFIRSWHPDLVALHGRSSGGTAWAITDDRPFGGVHRIDDVDMPPGAMWADAPGDDGHHGYVHVGPVTASEPHVR